MGCVCLSVRERTRTKNFKKTGLLYLYRVFFLAFCALLLPCFGSTRAAEAGQATLGWSASSSTGVIGYRVYFGTSSGNYTQNIDVGNATDYTVASLIDGQTYYFAARAYDSAGNLSGYSNEISKTITSTTPSTYTITATANSSGTITVLNNANVTTSSSGTSVISTVTVSSGASQTFSITPNSGYSVSGVTVDGTSVGAVTSYTFTNVTANHTIAATFTANTVNAYTLTSGAGTGGAISPAGAITVNSGSSQAYTITPNAGYAIAGVTVDGTAVGAVSTYTFTNVNANHTISATFSASTGSSNIPQTGWVLKYVDSQETAGDNGAATNAFDGQTYTFWHTQWYNVTPPPCPHEIQIDLGATYTLNGFSYLPRQDGQINGTIAQYEFYVSSDGVNWGTPVSAGTFANNTLLKQAPFTAANGRYIRLRALSEVNGGPWTSAAEINVTGTPASGSATTTYAISATSGAGGAISPSGTTTVSSGASQSYTITPNSGYAISGVTVDGTSVGAVGTYTFSNIAANHTISATFAATTVSYGITASAGSGGSISPSGTVSVAAGSSRTFSITPSKRYGISQVLVDGVSVGAVSSYTFGNIAGNHTIQATFLHK